MTGLAGIAWFFYTMATGKTVRFINQSIQFQLPILVLVVLIKLSILTYYKFKTQKKLFKANVYLYVGFLIVVVILDFSDNII